MYWRALAETFCSTRSPKVLVKLLTDTHSHINSKSHTYSCPHLVSKSGHSLWREGARILQILYGWCFQLRKHAQQRQLFKGDTVVQSLSACCYYQSFFSDINKIHKMQLCLILLYFCVQLTRWGLFKIKITFEDCPIPLKHTSKDKRNVFYTQRMHAFTCKLAWFSRRERTSMACKTSGIVTNKLQ